jgi:hypothetical protein
MTVQGDVDEEGAVCVGLVASVEEIGTALFQIIMR